jgi:putative membrane protein
MTQASTTDPAPGREQVQLALERTYLAYERTLMAWIRTAASLITLGFTLYKFFQFLHDHEPAGGTHHILGARLYGMLMIGIGVITLTLATWQHQQSAKALRAQYHHAPLSLALVLAALISALGIVALVAAFFQQ